MSGEGIREGNEDGGDEREMEGTDGKDEGRIAAHPSCTIGGKENGVSGEGLWKGRRL
jgi:hypothetical protein